MKRIRITGDLVSMMAALIVSLQPAYGDSANDHLAASQSAEAKGSMVMDTVHNLADVFGPRLTSSPANRAAAEWAAARMRSWGMANVHLEPWTFGHSGWRNVRAVGELLTDREQPIKFGVAAWTPGTKGPQMAEVVIIDPPETTTATVLDSYLQSMKASVRGRMVMIGHSRIVTPKDVTPVLDAETLAKIKSGKPVIYQPDTSSPAILTRRQWNERIDAFLVEAQALVRIDDARRPYGAIAARANRTYDTSKAVASVVLRNEDYGRIVRLLDDKRLVRMRFDIENASNADGRIAYNVVGDITGTEKPDELVILGAHLDSWQMATGAADNAVGCAIMMEVGRLIEALHLRPHRTIRIVLWSGEEEGLLGSQAYVADHFGTFESPRAGFDRVVAYMNIDGGSGRIRGANIFGPPEAAAFLNAMLNPVAQLGVEGVIPHSVRHLGSTDATTFSRAGITSIGLAQDPLTYPIAWHSDLDTYERIDQEQAEQAVIVTASLALALADAPTIPPKFTGEAMPAPVGPPPAGGSVRRP